MREWKTRERQDWQDAIDDYDRKVESGELQFNAIGDIIPDGPEQPGWVAFVATKLPEGNFSKRG